MLLGRISRAKIMSDLANFFAGQELANSAEQSLLTIMLFRYREQRPKLYVCFAMKMSFLGCFRK
jgi:hypothetical protein